MIDSDAWVAQAHLGWESYYQKTNLHTLIRFCHFKLSIDSLVDKANLMDH